MCFELSEKMGGLSGLDGLSGVSSSDPWEESLRSALTNLGFKEDAVLPVVAELRASKPPLVEAIRQALKALQR
jgi:Holliday junction DNA helicase RuvA